jgi:hypothetical protein
MRPRVLLVVLVGVLLVWAAVGLLFPPAYATDDDSAMTMIVSGTGFAGAPDEHLVFSNVVLGRLLSAAYRRAPAVPWYGAYLIGVQVLTQLGLLYAVTRLGPSCRGPALYALYFVVVALSTITNLQFTTTAFAATQAGVLALLSWQERPPEGRVERILLALLAGLLLVLGALVRFEAFGLALAVAAPAALVLAWRRPRDVRGWRPLVGPVAVAVAAVVLALAARAYDRGYYRADPRWAEFREFNDLLRQFVDYGRAAEFTPETASVFREVGWTRNDQRLMMQWFHPDPAVVSVEKMRRILAAFPADPPGTARSRLSEQLRRVAANRMALPMFLSLPLVALLCAARGRAAVLLSALASSATALVLLAIFMKAPPHVYLSLLGWPIALGVLLAGAEGSAASRRWNARSLLVLAGVAAAAGVVRSVVLEREEAKDGQERRRALERSLRELGPRAEQLVVAWVSAFPYKAIPPLGDPDLLHGLRLYSMGWPARTPVALETLAALGTPDPIDGLVRRPDAVLIAPAEVTPWLERYVEQHYGRQVRFAATQRTPSFIVFQARVATVSDKGR